MTTDAPFLRHLAWSTNCMRSSQRFCPSSLVHWRPHSGDPDRAAKCHLLHRPVCRFVSRQRWPLHSWREPKWTPLPTGGACSHCCLALYYRYVRRACLAFLSVDIFFSRIRTFQLL